MSNLYCLYKEKESSLKYFTLLMFLRLLQLFKKIPVILVVHVIPLNILAPKFLDTFQESQFVLDKINRAQKILSISIAVRRELYPAAPVSPSLLLVRHPWAKQQMEKSTLTDLGK